MIMANVGMAALALRVREDVVKDIDGRAADGGPSLAWLALMAAMAGPGNHVEIGSLFGASAIAVALMKKRMGLPGNVICIDPYEPRTVGFNPKEPIPKGTAEGNHDALMANAKKLGVELIHIQKRSQPWPEELKDFKFISGYIDGDHIGEVPYLDFLALENSGCRYIGFDNYEEGYPDVVKAANRVIAERSDKWHLLFKDMIFCSFRHPLPGRDKGAKLGEC